MIRRCDDDGVDFLVIKNAAKILLEFRLGLDLAADFLHRAVITGLITIAESLQNKLAGFIKGAGNFISPAAHADDGRANLRWSLRGNHRDSSHCGRGGRLNKFSAVYRTHTYASRVTDEFVRIVCRRSS